MGQNKFLQAPTTQGAESYVQNVVLEKSNNKFLSAEGISSEGQITQQVVIEKSKSILFPLISGNTYQKQVPIQSCEVSTSSCENNGNSGDEVDPIFRGSPAFLISNIDISNWNTAFSQRINSLTTIGNSGNATFISNILNIPLYTLEGLGGQPILNGLGFVKVNGNSISYDNNSYYLASNPSNFIALTNLSSSATGLTYTNTSGIFSLTTGYTIPTTTEQSNWNTAYSWGNWSGHKHSQLYQPNGSNPFVYTDNAGQLHIDGNIIQLGSSYETHAEQLYTVKDTIILRDGAIGGLAPGVYTGIVAKKYDGVNDGQLVFDNNGWARVGDVGLEQMIATRIDTPTNSFLAIWDDANKRLDFINQNTFAISDHTHTGVYVPYTGAGSSVNLGAYNLTATSLITTDFRLGTSSTSGYVLTTDALGNGTWLAPFSGVTGSGTIGALPKFTASSTLGDSLISESSSLISINGKLTVSSTDRNIPTTTGGELIPGAGWTTTGWTGDIATGYTHTTGNTSTLTIPYSFTNGVNYLLSVEITGITAGSVQVTLGVLQYTISSTTLLNPYYFGYRGNSTYPNIRFVPSSNFNGKIANVSLKSLSGTFTSPVTKIYDLEIRNPIGFIEGNTEKNIFIGKETAAYFVHGDGNIALGYRAMLNSLSGYGNIMIGASAGALVQGSVNIGIGNGALGASTYASGQVAIGYNAGHAYNEGSNGTLVAIGYTAGQGLTAGFNVTIVGAGALTRTSSAGYNTAIGGGAGDTTGAGNVFVGATAGSGATTVVNCVYLGYNAGNKNINTSQLSSANNSIAIGYNTFNTASNQVVLGNASITETILRGTVTVTAFKLGTSTTAGYVLTADASGNGTWQTSIGGASFVSAPTTKTSTGTAGQIAYDGNYFYICTATNTWTRTTMVTNW